MPRRPHCCEPGVGHMVDRVLDTEFLIIGAGPGGSAAAWALARLGHDVLMVDHAQFPRDKTCGDGLTPMALNVLREMRVLEAVEEQCTSRITTVRLMGPFGVRITLPFDTLGQSYDYGLVLPRVALDDTLRRHAQGRGVSFMGAVQVEEITRQGDRVVSVAASENGQLFEIRPRQVIFAVGANMGLLRREGLVPKHVSYVRAARAYYDDVDVPSDTMDFYLDATLMPGYGWVFPVGDGQANVGIGIMPSLWATKRPITSLLEDFERERAREGVMSRARRTGPVKGYPLRVDFPSHRVAGENWAIIGEAAGLVNPVTGEGIDLALESGMMAADLIHDDLRRGARDHISYQRELWERFGPLYSGMRVLRDIIATPFFTDYVFFLMQQHGFLKRITFRLTQGLQPPQDVFHPLFILQFFTALSPLWVVRQLARRRIR